MRRSLLATFALPTRPTQTGGLPPDQVGGPATRPTRSLLAPLVLLLALAPVLVAGTALAQEPDVEGAADYPGIGRFAGSRITGYEVKDFDATKVQAAPFKDDAAVDERRPEGRISRIAYRTGPGASILEVFRNFTGQLEAAGFETLLSCDADACGGLTFARDLDILPLPQMWVDGFDYRYYAGRKADGTSETFATVVVSGNNDEVTAQLVVAEVGAMAKKMVDAAAMAKGLGEAGHIALYGIYFDTDKAVLKPESGPTLAEIAALLNGEPGLNVVIVGHTDSQGDYDYNIDLSKRRAAAVAKALATSYGIAGGRMRTAGVGYLAPVGSNANEDGRALNRRVELVKP